MGIPAERWVLGTGRTGGGLWHVVGSSSPAAVNIEPRTLNFEQVLIHLGEVRKPRLSVESPNHNLLSLEERGLR